MKETDFIDCSESIVTDTKSDQSHQMIKGIVADLRQVVDQIDKDFKKARDLITEIARRLDEGRFCEQAQICRRIKEMLQDKIKEGKITSKWIEDCLPQQYKRKYISKSEVSSLSEDDIDAKAEKILIDTSGLSSSVDSSQPNQNEGSAQNMTLAILDNQSHQTDCPRCNELEHALLRASPVVSADKLQNEDNTTYQLPKEKHALLVEVMKSSQQYCSVVFDKNGILVDAKPDVPGI